MMAMIPLALSMPGGGEWILIFLAILVLFGAKRIPEIARGLGKGIREFKSATRDIADELNDASKLDAPSRPSTGAPQARGTVQSTSEQPGV